ncbi:hypothetical protein ACFFQW_09505 [Umezawaea endophytica]|uniref:Uncharacterized protein n=1 Tax=Umezawaea endophytica TaxID=1654476 RepID=A0A9X2VS07_9PSEU|nr:hypothetical protein [Umezawaea endophytica]MCS7481287.1 hypothetical protein [Umezawaea endophytica]
MRDPGSPRKPTWPADGTVPGATEPPPGGAGGAGGLTTGGRETGGAGGALLAELGGALDDGGGLAATAVPEEIVESVPGEETGLPAAGPQAAVSTAPPATIASMNLFLVLRDAVLSADN